MRYILLAFMTGALSAASYTIETSATCEIVTQHEVVRSTPPNYTDGCHVESIDGSYAGAEVDAYVVPPEPWDVGSAPTLSLVVGVGVRLMDVDPDPEVWSSLHESVFAHATASATMFLTTGGPVRPGVLKP